MPRQRHPIQRHVDHRLPRELTEQVKQEAVSLGVSEAEYVRQALTGWLRWRETIEVLSDPDAVTALADTEPVVLGRDAIRALVAERVARESQEEVER